MKFNRAPRIGNAGGGRIYAEGIDGLSPQQLASFEEAVNRYGLLVPVGAEWIGAKWLKAIQERGDEPGASALRATISHVMDVPRFAEATANSELQDNYSATAEFGDADVLDPDDFVPADYLEVKAHPFDLTEGFKLAVPKNGGLDHDAPLQRMLSILSRPPVGPETFTDEENADARAQFNLVVALTNNLGYSGFATGVEDGSTARKVAPAADSGEQKLTVVRARQSLHSFLGSLRETDWTPQKSVYLVRPAPLVNPFPSQRPFEAFIGHGLIGFRLPRAMIEREVELMQNHAHARAQEIRARAAALLQEASEIDGYQPRLIAHTHRHGVSTTIAWASPVELASSEEDIVRWFFDDDFDGETEDLDVDLVKIDELAGVGLPAPGADEQEQEADVAQDAPPAPRA